MRMKLLSALWVAFGVFSVGIQPGVAQVGGAAAEQVIQAGDTTYRGRFVVDPVSGAVNGLGKVEWRNGNRYEGPVKNSQLTGSGKFAWSNGDRYEGEMTSAEPNGQGTYYYKSGDRYSGAWKNGQKHGQGRYTFADGSYWEGQYANDRQVSGAMGNLGGSVAEVQRSVAPSTQQAPIATREALPIVAAEPKRERVQPAKTGAGDPNKYSTTPGNPSCRFFDGFADNGDGTVTDPRTQLVWKRCSEGQTWNGAACAGRPTTMNWYDAMQAAKSSRFLGKNDWRLPGQAEFSAVMGDYDGGCRNNKLENGQYAVSGVLGQEKYYWSYLPDVGSSSFAWVGNFNAGYVSQSYRGNDFAVRLVRASQSSGDAAASAAFNAEYKKIGAYKAEETAKERRVAQRREAEEKRRISYENSSAAREDRQRTQRCSHLYVGKIVTLYDAFGIKTDATVQGVGTGVATVKYLSLGNDWAYKEFSCDQLR